MVTCHSSNGKQIHSFSLRIHLQDFLKALKEGPIFQRGRVFPSPSCLGQGSLTPGPRTSSCPRAVRDPAAQQEGSSGGQASEASSAVPHPWNHCLNQPCTPSPPPNPRSICGKLSLTKPVPDAKSLGTADLGALLAREHFELH